MLFLNPYLLLALLGVAVPVLIHLFNRRNAREIPWGAMRFLLDSLMRRRRSLLLEEMLLLAVRCLLVGAAVLAFARPFVQAGSSFPWWVVMPVGLMAFVLFGIGFALGQHKVWRFFVWTGCLLCLLACAGAVFFEERLGLSRFSGGGARTIAIVLDGSSSMTLENESGTNFDLARAEAVKLVERAPRGTAFSVLVAGAVPVPLVPTPVSDRKYVLKQLEAATPVQGVMRVPDALAAAAASLAQGNGASPRIVLFGDGQAMGWQTDDLDSWRSLKEAFGRLPEAPKTLTRILPLPQGVRNVAVKAITFSRPVVGADREVRIDATLVNTGHESVTPSKVVLRIGTSETVDRSVTQMEPGAERQVSFVHQFKEAGAQVVEVAVDAHDELPSDDVMRRVIQVVGHLNVLVVDDGRGGSALQRAGGYLALALMPSFAELQATRERQGRTGREALRFMLRPDWISVNALGLRENLADTAMVVLADVPNLPAKQAEQIALFVKQGGSLLVTHGPRSEAAFYNGWKEGDARFLPMAIGDCVVRKGTGAADDGMRLGSLSFTHPALALFRDQGDLADAVVDSYRAVEGAADDPCVVARFQNGQPLLAEKTVGRGRILQLLMPLDATAGGLVARQAFLPLVHELVGYLARPRVAALNIPPSLGAVVRLAPPTGTGGHGLTGMYYRKGKSASPILVRVDPTVAFDWGDRSPGKGVPSDNFAVRWSGSFVPPKDGTYRFYIQGDDRTRLTVGNGGPAVTRYVGEKQDFAIALKAGEHYPVAVELEEDNGGANIRVECEGPEMPRRALPTACLYPHRGNTASWADATDTWLTDEKGRRFFGKLRQTEEGVALRTEHPLIQGLYTVEVPESASEWLGGLAGENGTGFPLCVTGDARESMLDPLTPEERELLFRQTDLLFADSYDDLVKALSGKTFGRELWRIPALLLFLLLVVECFLTRWIAIRRS
ncbi:MAG: BatA domain-containing protein [Kiritimatiellae bacterium]|nr:BatA domain-containing protein [Kiritimatiellia bacterium]